LQYYLFIDPPNPDNVPEDGKLKSSHIIGGTRRYYLDLKENQRGRFLRVSQTQPRGGPRSQIAIPAQGMGEFGDTLSKLLEDYGTDDQGKILCCFCWECREIVESFFHCVEVGSSRVIEMFVIAETSVELPESKSMRVENKMFYFDIGQNNRGTYMRISEVGTS